MRMIAVMAVSLCAVMLPGAARGATGPPVIDEPFTLLPCPTNPRTTIDVEACLEKTLVRTDRAIDTRVRAIFALLRSGRGRTSFAAGERSWLRYRRSSCSAQATSYAGGSLEPVAFLRCQVNRNKAHLEELAGTKRALRRP